MNNYFDKFTDVNENEIHIWLFPSPPCWRDSFLQSTKIASDENLT